MVVGHLRRPEQWRRMAYVIILTSLPIALYGILQRSGLDPLPWGGDVRRRVAANMGNAIFVAAYLSMAFFLTLERLLQHFGRLLRAQDNKTGIADAVLAGCYFAVVIIQSITILMTQSRGPFLGWSAGLFVFGLLVLLGVRAWATAHRDTFGAFRGVLRWSWVGWILLVVIGLSFLVVFNLPNSPLASLRADPNIGRLGTALDLEANTARVRTLIWEGAAELVAPHDPLLTPATGGEGDVMAMSPDRLNALRPLIGYGPEAMWVAFNRYYPPDLAHHESRNASPDRSHNEMWDSLVISGALGFIAYMALFLSVFYFALKWLGLIQLRSQRLLFFGLALGLGALGALIPRAVEGSWILLGVGLPAGLILGIITYVVIATIWNEVSGHSISLGQRELVLITILATMVAHFIEIHFGIAIASTRTYFWVWSGVLVVVGMGWLQLGGVTPAAEAAPSGPVGSPKAGSSISKAAPPARKAGSPSPAGKGAKRPATTLSRRDRDPGGHWGEVIIYAVIAGIILFTLAYDYTINANVLALRESSPLLVFLQAFTTRIVKEAGTSQRITSLGIFWLTFFVWFVGMAVALADIGRSQPERLKARWLGLGALIFTAISGGIFLVFGLLHAAGIASDTRRQTAGAALSVDDLASMVSSHIVVYYVIILLLIAALGVVIWRTRPGTGKWLANGGWLGPVVGVVLTLLALVLIFTVNVSLVRADIIYKQGQAYDAAKRYDESTRLYELAIQEEPREDYYYLFLGRAQLEKARESTGNERSEFLLKAQQSLLRAQELNPMNTDHSANLGRLYLAWAQLVGGDERAKMLQKSLDYYQVATTLSPNAAHLRNEYASAYQFAGQPDKAMEQYEVSLQLDQIYADTYRRLGDFYRQSNQPDLAIQTYEQGVQVAPRNIAMRSTLGLLYADQGELDKAIEQNLAVLQIRPTELSSLRNLAVLYEETGDLASALSYAQQALDLTQDDADKTELQSLILEIQARIGSTGS
jgi:tetratricopeptide (TPR) repeat protein